MNDRVPNSDSSDIRNVLMVNATNISSNEIAQIIDKPQIITINESKNSHGDTGGFFDLLKI